MAQVGMILNNIYRSLLSIQRKGSIIEVQRDGDSQSHGDKIKHDLNSLHVGVKGHDGVPRKRSSFQNQLPGITKGPANLKSINSPDASGHLNVSLAKKGGPQVPVLGVRERSPSESKDEGSGSRPHGTSRQDGFQGRRNNISP